MDILMEVLSGRIPVVVVVTQVLLREVVETLILAIAMAGIQPTRMEVTIILVIRLLGMVNMVAPLTP